MHTETKMRWYVEKKQVVVIGGGFGGLHVARALKHAHVNVMLIDKSNHHLFQPLLYEVATAALSPGHIATPLREVLRDQENTTVVMGEVIEINKEKKTILLANKDTISYDYLVIAIGARHSYFGKNEWEIFAPGLKTIRDALKIREQILLSFEKAERLLALEGKQEPVNFVIIGGGPTGVEMAGSIAEIAKRTLHKNFRYIEPQKAGIYLVEALPTILPAFPQQLTESAEKMLEKLGVTVLKGQKVTEINGKGVQVGDRFIPSNNIIWAAGNQVSDLLKSLNTPLDRAGRAIVEPDLTLKDHPEVFVIGDAASATGKEGKPLPGVAPVAMQQGRYVAKLIKRGLQGKQRPPFVYFDKGSMATIGKMKAIAMVGSFKTAGFFAWLMWAFVHILFLIGFRNRLGVAFEWMAAIFTGERGARLITHPIDKK